MKLLLKSLVLLLAFITPLFGSKLRKGTKNIEVVENDFGKTRILVDSTNNLRSLQDETVIDGDDGADDGADDVEVGADDGADDAGAPSSSPGGDDGADDGADDNVFTSTGDDGADDGADDAPVGDDVDDGADDVKVGYDERMMEQMITCSLQLVMMVRTMEQ